MVGLEALEGRRLLSGGVTAEIVGGNLVIRGGRLGNNIRIESVATVSPRHAGHAETVRVLGVNTRVNGEFEATFANLGGDVIVSLGDGRNTVIIDGLDLADDLIIKSGRHGDAVHVRDTRAEGDLLIGTRGGDDVVSLQSVEILGDWTVNTSAGEDVITADKPSTFSRAGKVDAGPGRDSTAFSASGGIATLTGVETAGELLEHRFDFGQGKQGWRVGYADWFRDRADEHDVAHSIRDLPASVGVDGKGYFVKSNNFTDDILMYLTRPFTEEDGLKPSTEYLLTFDLAFASNAQSGCGGIGGSPGDSVFVKAGGSTRRPATKTDKEGLERSTIDHGQQAGDGRNMSVSGVIANGQECDGNGTFKTVTQKHVHRYRVRTDANGRLHVIFGTESGFEGTTALFYQSATVGFAEIA